MKGSAEFLALFVPFLLVGLGTIYLNLTNSFGLLIEGLLWLIAVVCLGINVFALLVQYVNWRYYKE